MVSLNYNVAWTLNVTGADMTAWVAPCLKFRVVCSAAQLKSVLLW